MMSVLEGCFLCLHKKLCFATTFEQPPSVVGLQCALLSLMEKLNVPELSRSPGSSEG